MNTPAELQATQMLEASKYIPDPHEVQAVAVEQVKQEARQLLQLAPLMNTPLVLQATQVLELVR